MWHKSFSTITKDVTKEQIWEVLSDINRWKDWDEDIEWIELNGTAKLNADFLLKPKGGPKTKLTISEFDAPNVFADVAHLPLAKMHTIHTLSQMDKGIKIDVDIKIVGALTFLWSKVIGQKQIDGGPEQTEKLIKRAKNR